jgi:hypothetical protein
LENAQPFYGETDENILIERLLNAINRIGLSEGERPIALGAAFDLLVAAEYYGVVGDLRVVRY